MENIIKNKFIIIISFILIIIVYITYNNSSNSLDYNKLAIDCWTDNVKNSIGDSSVLKDLSDIEVTKRIDGVKGDLVVSGTLVGQKKNEKNVTLNFIKTKEGITLIKDDKFYDSFNRYIKEFIENNK
jgi:hypothetical protein